MIEFGIYVEQGHRRYRAWVIGDREKTEVSAPTRADVVKRLAEDHLDDSEPAGPLDRNVHHDAEIVLTGERTAEDTEYVGFDNTDDN